MWQILKTLSKLFDVGVSFHINSNITALLVTSVTKWEKQELEQMSGKHYATFPASGHRQSSFCTEDPLWLSYKVFIRVTLEINNRCETINLFGGKYTFRFTPHRPSDQGLNRTLEKQTLNSLQNVAAKPCQTSVPDNYSTWNSSPKFREILIHFCLCHFNTYLQNALAYLEKDWYYT